MSAAEPTNRAIDPDGVAAALAGLPPQDILDLVVAAFEALAVTTIMPAVSHALVQRPLCVRDLAIVAGVSESATSHQLRLLRDRRLVRSRRAGNVIYYAVDDHHVAALFREAEYHADHVRRALPDHSYPLP